MKALWVKRGVECLPQYQSSHLCASLSAITTVSNLHQHYILCPFILTSCTSRFKWFYIRSLYDPDILYNFREYCTASGYPFEAYVLRKCWYACFGLGPPFYSCTLSHGVSVRFLRFRLGCHHLRIQTGPWHQAALPRSHHTLLSALY
jgi:hypothetical protein